MCHCSHQMIAMGLLKPLRSWYLFVNVIGQVPQDAHAILYWLNWDSDRRFRWKMLCRKMHSIRQSYRSLFTLTHPRSIFRKKMYWWVFLSECQFGVIVTLENFIHYFIPLVTCITCLNQMQLWTAINLNVILNQRSMSGFIRGRRYIMESNWPFQKNNSLDGAF